MRSQSGGSDGLGDRSKRPRRGAAGRAHTRSNQELKPHAGDSPKGTAGSQRTRLNPLGVSAAVPTWSGGNRVLAALPAEERSFLRAMLVSSSLTTGQILYEQGSRIQTAYFPDTAVTSLVSHMENGAAVEVGTIGNEGVVGLSLFLGADVSVPEVVAQVPGIAQQMSARDFRSALETMVAPHS